MKYSVFSYPYTIRYYLTHPWKWVQDFFLNCKAAYRRAIYGWTWTDCWELYDWILHVFPEMFRHMANNGCGYPARAPFETSEKWHDWLNSIADVLESCQDENWEHQNEYEQEFDDTVDVWQAQQKNHIAHTISEEEFKHIKDLYFNREKELHAQRCELIKDTLNQIGEHFFDLWD